MPEAILMRFGDEELKYLTSALKIGDIPCARSTILDSLDADHFALAMAVADRSLRARGVVLWQSEDERDYSPLPAAVLRIFAAPRFSALVDIRQGTETAALAYAFADQNAVEYTTPEPGVQQFVLMSTSADVEQRLTDLARVEHANAGTGHGRLPRAVFSSVQGLAAQSRQSADQALASYMAPADAGAFLSTLAAPIKQLGVAVKEGNLSNGIELGRFVALVGPGGYWVAMPTTNQPDWVDVHGATQEQVRDYLLRLLRAPLGVFTPT